MASRSSSRSSAAYFSLRSFGHTGKPHSSNWMCAGNRLGAQRREKKPRAWEGQ